jgi:hypothetical protein
MLILINTEHSNFSLMTPLESYDLYYFNFTIVCTLLFVSAFVCAGETVSIRGHYYNCWKYLMRDRSTTTNG